MAKAEQKYELMVIIDSAIGLALVEKRFESIKKQISKHGEIFFEDFWGERDLAYPMKKKVKGYYAVLGCTFDSSKLVELETSLRLEPEVIRHIVVKLPLKYEPRSFEKIQADNETKKEEEAAAKAKK